VLQESESISAESDGLPPLGNRSDRQAAHYYRSMHARAVQREQRWKQRALEAEQIIKQLLVLVASCVDMIGAITRQVTWLNKQQFGNKSESTAGAGGHASSRPGGQGGGQRGGQGGRSRRP
jgi:hypothetical protein